VITFPTWRTDGWSTRARAAVRARPDEGAYLERASIPLPDGGLDPDVRSLISDRPARRLGAHGTKRGLQRGDLYRYPRGYILLFITCLVPVEQGLQARLEKEEP
jgi:hypothetical protein